MMRKATFGCVDIQLVSRATCPAVPSPHPSDCFRSTLSIRRESCQLLECLGRHSSQVLLPFAIHEKVCWFQSNVQSIQRNRNHPPFAFANCLTLPCLVTACVQTTRYAGSTTGTWIASTRSFGLPTRPPRKSPGDRLPALDLFQTSPRRILRRSALKLATDSFLRIVSGGNRQRGPCSPCHAPKL